MPSQKISKHIIFAGNATAKCNGQTSRMDFKDRLEHIIHHGSISFALQIAKDVGIFEALCQADRPLTSQQLADSKKLKER